MIVTGGMKKKKADKKERMDSEVLFFIGCSGKTSKESNIWTETSKLTEKKIIKNNFYLFIYILWLMKLCDHTLLSFFKHDFLYFFEHSYNDYFEISLCETEI